MRESRPGPCPSSQMIILLAQDAELDVVAKGTAARWGHDGEG